MGKIVSFGHVHHVHVEVSFLTEVELCIHVKRLIWTAWFHSTCTHICISILVHNVSCTIHCLDVPIKPVVTMVTVVGSTSLQVSWTYKGFIDNLKEYQLEAQEVSKQCTMYMYMYKNYTLVQ